MTNNNISWQQLLAKHGPWALGCAVLGFVVYAFVLTPSKLEREAFIETSRQNAESAGIVADSTCDIKRSVDQQVEVLKDIKGEIEGQTELRNQAMDTMNAFAEEMRIVNPANGIKLDVIIKKLEADQNSQKLDIIIEKMEVLQNEPNPTPEE